MSFFLVKGIRTAQGAVMEANSDPGLSSLIVTLSGLSALRASALDVLAGRSDLELGEAHERWLPAVLTSADPYGVFRELEAIPGVELVEVVFVELATPVPV
jgi:hypothetical protein